MSNCPSPFKQLFIGVMLSDVTMSRGCAEAIQLALRDAPDFQSSDIVIRYYPTFEPSKVEANATQFLADSAYTPYRTVVTETSNLLIAYDSFFVSRSVTVLVLDVSASANTISKQLGPNAMTYGYFNHILVSSFFLALKTYQLQRILLIVENSEARHQLFTEDLVQQVMQQAKVLRIPIEMIPFSQLTSVSSLINTAVFLIAGDIVLNANVATIETWANRVYVQNSFIMLSEIAEEAQDMFGPIPAFVAVPWPLDYTSTSVYIFRSIAGPILHDILAGKKFLAYEVYPLYQIMYSHAVNTTLPGFWEHPYTLSRYLDMNTFQSRPPPWLYSNGFDHSKHGPQYGLFHCVLTKNVLYSESKEIFEQRFLAGVPILKNSFSSLFRIGRTGYDSSEMWIDRNTVWHIYQSGKLSVARNSFDLTNISPMLMSQNGCRDLIILYTLDPTGQFFSFLSIQNPLILNQRMSVPLIQLSETPISTTPVPTTPAAFATKLLHNSTQFNKKNKGDLWK